MASASRRYRPKVKKDPATPEMSKSQVESRITDKSLTLPSQIDCFNCCVDYTGVFHFSE